MSNKPGSRTRFLPSTTWSGAIGVARAGSIEALKT
jgi:hypothetical protein